MQIMPPTARYSTPTVLGLPGAGFGHIPGAVVQKPPLDPRIVMDRQVPYLRGHDTMRPVIVAG